jgi:alcohol dehydrogenase class IV
VTSRIRLDSNALLGQDAALKVPRELGDVRAGVVVDEAVQNQPAARRVLERWAEAGLALDPVFAARSGREPDYDYLDEVAAVFRAVVPDVVIAIGGGSTLDLGKGVAILLRNDGTGIDYRGLDRVERPGAPVVCVPTTAGSGSEATATASFIDRRTQAKLGINGRHVAPALAALDPVLLAGCPRSVTIGSGLDALVHAVEAVTARTATHISVLLGCEAVRLLFASLSRCVEEPGDLDARQDSLLGAHLAALAMQNAAGGPASGVSYPVGVHFGVPHGYAGGVLLPHVVAANTGAGCCDGYGRLAAAVGVVDFAEALFDLYRRIDAPLTLEPWDVGRDDVETLLALTLAQRAESLKQNPVPFGRDEVVELLEAVTTPRQGS